MYAPVCSVQRLAELQVPGNGRHEAGGGWRVSIQRLAELQAAGGLRQVATGGWRMVAENHDIGQYHDVGRYHSLNLIFSPATLKRSHDASWSWC
jgi:hypothetical protein